MIVLVGVTPTVAAGGGTLPHALGGAAVVAVDATAFAFGGATGGSDGVVADILRLDEGGRVTSLGALPTARAEAAAVRTGSGFLVIGGVGSDGRLLRDVLAVDAVGSVTREIAALPEGLSHTSAARLGDVVYVFGGLQACADDCPIATDKILSIDPATGRVEVLHHRLPEQLAGLHAMEDGDRVLLAGGFTAGVSGSRPSDTV